MPDIPTEKTSTPDMPSPSQDRAAGAGPANAAANGYWVHDGIGPRHYVAPPESGGGGDAEGDVVARLREVLSARPEFSRMHVAIVAGEIVLSGTAVSSVDRDRAEAAVRVAAGDLCVTNRCNVDETLEPRGEAP